MLCLDGEESTVKSLIGKVARHFITIPINIRVVGDQTSYLMTKRSNGKIMLAS